MAYSRFVPLRKSRGGYRCVLAALAGCTVPWFLGALGSVCSCLHLTFPSVYVPYVCIWLALPEPRQRPFRLGITLSGRLWIPVSFRLPAFASWSGPAPAGDFSRRCRWLTSIAAGPHQGCHVPHEGDATGVGAAFTPGPWCPWYSMRTVLYPPRSLMETASYGPIPPYQPSFRWLWHDGASSAVHLRSPVRSCPSPVSPDGWTFLRHCP